MPASATATFPSTRYGMTSHSTAVLVAPFCAAATTDQTTSVVRSSTPCMWCGTVPETSCTTPAVISSAHYATPMAGCVKKQGRACASTPFRAKLTLRIFRCHRDTSSTRVRTAASLLARTIKISMRTSGRTVVSIPTRRISSSIRVASRTMCYAEEQESASQYF